MTTGGTLNLYTNVESKKKKVQEGHKEATARSTNRRSRTNGSGRRCAGGATACVQSLPTRTCMCECMAEVIIECLQCDDCSIGRRQHKRTYTWARAALIVNTTSLRTSTRNELKNKIQRADSLRQGKMRVEKNMM